MLSLNASQTNRDDRFTSTPLARSHPCTWPWQLNMLDEI